MPRVSEAHRAARRQQIIDAAQVCFERNGFHSTSMQDVIAEAGLSVGAVYRYFPSKQELIRAIAEQALGRIDDTLDRFAGCAELPPLLSIVEGVIGIVDSELIEVSGRFRIAIQVWGEAQREPALAEMVASVYSTYRARCADLVTRAQAAGQVHADVDPSGIAGAVFGLVIGYAVQRVLLGDPAGAAYLAGLRELLAGTPGIIEGAGRPE